MANLGDFGALLEAGVALIGAVVGAALAFGVQSGEVRRLRKDVDELRVDMRQLLNQSALLVAESKVRASLRDKGETEP